MALIWVLAGVLIFLGGMYFYLYRKVTRHLPATFPTEANRKGFLPHTRRVVCFGDSNTHGIVSQDWVSEIASQMPDYQFINAGRNSDLTYTLLGRLSDVIACEPAYINILIGTNDVNATMSDSMLKRYRRIGKISEDTAPDLLGFTENIRKIITELQTKTKAEIAVMSLPVMGEDLAHKANLRADTYSEAIRTVAKETSVAYLPLRETQKAYLSTREIKSKHRFEETYQLMNASVIAHEFFGWSWDKVSARHGYYLTPDNLHQNSVSGGMIRQLLKDFLAQKK